MASDRAKSAVLPKISHEKKREKIAETRKGKIGRGGTRRDAMILIWLTISDVYSKLDSLRAPMVP